MQQAQGTVQIQRLPAAHLSTSPKTMSCVPANREKGVMGSALWSQHAGLKGGRPLEPQESFPWPATLSHPDWQFQSDCPLLYLSIHPTPLTNPRSPIRLSLMGSGMEHTDDSHHICQHVTLRHLIQGGLGERRV